MNELTKSGQAGALSQGELVPFDHTTWVELTKMLDEWEWTCFEKVESSLEKKGELDDEATTVYERV